jgi:hypothetical protein
MKKKEIKSLKLNKKSISHLQSKGVNGGAAASITIPTLGPLCVASALYCTRWDGCDLPTIGHDDGPNCLSQEADWCGGR